MQFWKTFLFIFNYFVPGNHLIIVGGYGNGVLSSVEVLDENKHLSCNISSYPISVHGHSSTVTASGILVCGGWRKDCYEYRSNSWTMMPPMTTKRSYFGMIHLKNKIYAVGGYDGSRSTNSMDIFESSTRTWTKQSIPFDVYHHCITELSANQLILLGGNTVANGQSGKVNKMLWQKIFKSKISLFYIALHKIFLQTLFSKF